MANTSTPAVRHVSVFTTHVMRASLKMTLQEKSGKVQGDRGVIRFLKNRIYPVFRAKLFRKSDLMLKKCRFALRKHENRPFLAIFAIFGNSVLSQPTIRHIPTWSLIRRWLQMLSVHFADGELMNFCQTQHWFHLSCWDKHKPLL